MVKKNIIIQWHITHKCNNNCLHCYEKNYPQDEILRLPELTIIFNKIKEFNKKYPDFIIQDIAITGGDPLLHPDYKEFIQLLLQNRMKVHILGNPETLTEESIKALKGISLYQLSLDGLENFHDTLRHKGSFSNTIQAIYRLKEAGIKTGLMFTLFKENKEDLLPLIDFINTEKIPVDYFAFDFGVLMTRKRKITNKFTLEEIKEIFNKYLDKTEENKGVKLLLKHPYLKIMKLEREGIEFKANPHFPCNGGCLIGYSFVIFSQGNMGLCARLNEFIGNALTGNIEEIFFNNERIKKFRRPEYYFNCKTCKYFQICRGCPALGKSLTGDPFKSDAFCFLYKESRNKFNIDKKEEYKIIRGR